MKVKFVPQNVEYEIEFNETVLHLAQRMDIHIQSVCKGLPSCAECRVCIKEGEHNVPPPSSKELSLIGTAYYIDQSRLSCQLRCFGDVTIDLSEQIEKEGRASKRPQGRAAKADGQESLAVKGNIIEEYTEDKELVTAINPNEERPGHDSFYDSFSKKKDGGNNRQQGRGGGNDRNRNRNNRGGGGGGNNRNPQQARGGGEGNRNQQQPREGGGGNRNQQQARGGGNRNQQARGGQPGGERNRNRDRHRDGSRGDQQTRNQNQNQRQEQTSTPAPDSQPPRNSQD